MNTTLNRLGLVMLTVETATFYWVYFVWSSIGDNFDESMEKCSEGKIFKSELQTTNGNVNAVYFDLMLKIFESVPRGTEMV